MKLLMQFIVFNLILILFISCSTRKELNYNQSKILGTYANNFGDAIEIRSDSTFMYKYEFDLISSWSIGKWKTDNDTIFFEIKSIMDTLRIRNSKSERLLHKSYIGKKENFTRLIVLEN